MKCIVCNTVLGKGKQRYCTKTCYDYRHNEIQKQKYKKRNPTLPKKPCVFCATVFQPKNERHICCDIMCRRLLENRKAREARKVKPKKERKPATLYFCTSFREEELRDKPKVESKLEKIITPKRKAKTRRGKIVIRPLPISNSEHSGQIEEFEKNGGKIQVFPPQCNGRTPDVNITSISGWSVETMFGYGYEIQLMEELNDVS